jgi:hypothetical protein
MDTQTDTNQVDEQELAKALADVDATNMAAIAEGKKSAKKVDVRSGEEEPAATPPAEPLATDDNLPEIKTDAAVFANATPTPGAVDTANGLVNATSSFTPTSNTSTVLDSIKANALQDLKPLIDKLNISAEEKFDIYLLIFKDSNDSSVIEPAYSVAKQIEDETKRANALLEIIKEVDAIENPNQEK